GALSYLASLLQSQGFAVQQLIFSTPGTATVGNLFATIGTGSPHLTFAGHTDVVPAGDPAAWTYPPFAAEIVNGELYGRGAVDMKGAIACFVAAAVAHLQRSGGQPRGSLSLLITGDEEGIAVNGTAKLLAWAANQG